MSVRLIGRLAVLRDDGSQRFMKWHLCCAQFAPPAARSQCANGTGVIARGKCLMCLAHPPVRPRRGRRCVLGAGRRRPLVKFHHAGLPRKPRQGDVQFRAFKIRNHAQVHKLIDQAFTPRGMSYFDFTGAASALHLIYFTAACVEGVA
jgi:hypothetical protein